MPVSVTPAAGWLVRLFALVEGGLGAWGLLAPGRVAGAAIASLYAVFALLALVLARHHAACGCFGTDEVPASGAQALTSGGLVLVCGLATVARPHGLLWLASHQVPAGAAAVLGTVAAAVALAILYTQAPMAWRAWSGR